MTLILYGIATERSIGRLFLAGVVPGILLAVLFIGVHGVRVREAASACHRRGHAAHLG